jgi:hypothetical protein
LRAVVDGDGQVELARVEDGRLRTAGLFRKLDANSRVDIARAVEKADKVLR